MAKTIRKQADDGQSNALWPGEIYRVLKQAGVTQASYVPDAGHAKLIQLLHADPKVATTVLTTEEEGIALSAGAWLGGNRAVLLLRSDAGEAPLGVLQGPSGKAFGNPADIAQLLFHDFLLPFEVTSILVLIAIMGAVVLAARPGSDQEKEAR